MASRVGAETVYQDNRRSLAVLFIMNSHSVGIEEWHPQTSPLVLYFVLCEPQEAVVERDPSLTRHSWQSLTAVTRRVSPCGMAMIGTESARLSKAGVVMADRKS